MYKTSPTIVQIQLSNNTDKFPLSCAGFHPGGFCCSHYYTMPVNIPVYLGIHLGLIAPVLFLTIGLLWQNVTVVLDSSGIINRGFYACQTLNEYFMNATMWCLTVQCVSCQAVGNSKCLNRTEIFFVCLLMLMSKIYSHKDKKEQNIVERKW